MIITSTTASVPFTPPWLEGLPEAPVFHLRAGSVVERGLMQAELAGEHRAGQVYDFELRREMRAGVVVLLAEDPELDTVLGAIEEEAELVGDAELSDDQVRLLKDVRDILRQHWPDYRDLIAQLERRRQVAPIVALKRFCVGWEGAIGDQGEPAPFARGRDGLVTDAALAGLSGLELINVGNRAYSLQFAAGQAGNSPRPGLSAKDPTTSPSDDTSTADGTSEASAGKKTPGSRSRRGSGRSSTSGSTAAASPLP